MGPAQAPSSSSVCRTALMIAARLSRHARQALPDRRHPRPESVLFAALKAIVTSLAPLLHCPLRLIRMQGSRLRDERTFADAHPLSELGLTRCYSNRIELGATPFRPRLRGATQRMMTLRNRGLGMNPSRSEAETKMDQPRTAIDCLLDAAVDSQIGLAISLALTIWPCAI